MLDEMNEELLSAAEVAEGLGVGKQTIAKYRKERGLPAIRLGGEWKFRKSAIHQWLRDQEVTQGVKKTVVNHKLNK